MLTFDNILTIRGDTFTLNRLLAQISRPFRLPTLIKTNDRTYFHYEYYRQPVFAFWNITKPRPEIRRQYFEADAPASRCRWDEWNTDHWGTPWDVANLDGETSTEMKRVNDQCVKYRFVTGLTAPDRGLVTLSRQYPTVMIFNHANSNDGRCRSHLFEAGRQIVLQSDQYGGLSRLPASRALPWWFD